MGAVREHFKPEFLNRLDDIVVFDSLSTEDLTQIVDIQLDALSKRLASRRLTLEVTDAAREWLALNGFDPLYGARPLRRLVQSAIGDALAKALLAGEIRDGQTVRVDARPTVPGSHSVDPADDPDDVVRADAGPRAGTARTTPTRRRSGTRWASSRSSSAASGW